MRSVIYGIRVSVVIIFYMLREICQFSELVIGMVISGGRNVEVVSVVEYVVIMMLRWLGKYFFIRGGSSMLFDLMFVNIIVVVVSSVQEFGVRLCNSILVVMSMIVEMVICLRLNCCLNSGVSRLNKVKQIGGVVLIRLMIIGDMGKLVVM